MSQVQVKPNISGTSQLEHGDRKPDIENQTLEPLVEVNENVASEIFEKRLEETIFEEIPPRIVTKKVNTDALTIESQNNAIYELGVVNLCWPEIKEPVFETRTCFPTSYYTNNNKERLLLAYAENFRRQINLHYKLIPPILLQAPNDCGLMKMVCTSIRPTKLCFQDTTDWKGVAALVCDFFEYEPLRKPQLHPERLLSPYSVIIRRKGNPFELAHVCASWLIGLGYDAYVVSGCAKRDVCMGITYRTLCPEVPDEREIIPELPPADEPRYRLVPLPDFTSKYMVSRAKKEAEDKQKELDKIEKKRLAKIAELEKPPPDDIDGFRIHAWVLIVPGMMGVEEPFFIEPREGFGYALDAPQYQRIDAVYNHENYYVNLQSSKDGLDKLNYELSELTCWEHLLAGEPNYRRYMIGVDQTDKRSAVDSEKHLDMPASWVEKLDISMHEYEQRYPGSYKLIKFKKVLLEKFSRYSQPDGIVKRVRTFDDYAWTEPLVTYEWYKNRVDMMEYAKFDHVERRVYENFGIGRRDHLLKHTYSMEAGATSIEAHRTMEFNYYARLDHLNKLDCTPLTFDEYYIDRVDRLEDRKALYKEGHKSDPKRSLQTLTETFSRNNAIPSKEDVWKRTFIIPEEKIELLYHYDYNFVTNNTRTFIKPNLAETGGKILFFPDKTSGYIADAIAKQPRPLNVYYALCDSMEIEKQSTKHIRNMETDIKDYLIQRHKELTEPMLFVGLYDTERNEAAKRGYSEQEENKAKMTEREKEAEIDPLAPYLARMFGSGHSVTSPLKYKEALLVKEQCLNDFKSKELARQLLVQSRFEAKNTQYKAKKLWYLANQYILTPEKENAYFEESASMAFDVHTLEVMLTRNADLSGPRFKMLEQYLDKHPLLCVLNKSKSSFRKPPKISLSNQNNERKSFDE